MNHARERTPPWHTHAIKKIVRENHSKLFNRELLPVWSLRVACGLLYQQLVFEKQIKHSWSKLIHWNSLDYSYNILDQTQKLIDLTFGQLGSSWSYWPVKEKNLYKTPIGEVQNAATPLVENSN